MCCVECHCEREPDDAGWVIVLASCAARRIAYCPDCMARLIREASGEEEDARD